MWTFEGYFRVLAQRYSSPTLKVSVACVAACLGDSSAHVATRPQVILYVMLDVSTFVKKKNRLRVSREDRAFILSRLCAEKRIEKHTQASNPTYKHTHKSNKQVKQVNKQADTQADKQTNNQINKLTSKQANKLASYLRAEKLRSKQTHKLTHKLQTPFRIFPT